MPCWPSPPLRFRWAHGSARANPATIPRCGWRACCPPAGSRSNSAVVTASKQARDSIETGRWSLKGDIETIDIVTVNGRPDPREDVYRILSHDARTQTYRYLRTGFFYKSVAVDGSFQLPPCGLMS